VGATTRLGAAVNRPGTASNSASRRRRKQAPPAERASALDREPVEDVGARRGAPASRWTPLMTHHPRCAGPLDLWTSGPLDLWTSGPLDLWTDYAPSRTLPACKSYVPHIIFIHCQISPPSIHATHPWEISSQLHQLRIRIVHGLHGRLWSRKVPGKRKPGLLPRQAFFGAYPGWRHSFNWKVPRTHEHRHETGLTCLP